MVRIAALLGVLALTVLVAAPASAERRYALLIGNSAYPGQPQEPAVWDRLPNAANDVTLLAKAFWRDGFTDVVVARDATYRAFTDAIARFAGEADGADVAVVYYAGHGFEYGRKNYLAPIDAPTSVTEAELPKTFIDFEAVASVAAKAHVNIFFLDACRSPVSFVKVTASSPASDPPSSAPAAGAAEGPRAATRGLVAIEHSARGFGDIDYPPDGHLAVVYSTARGETAMDASPPPADYSPFAWEVSRDIVVPHVDLGVLFETIREDVIQHTKSSHPSQAPYTYASIGPGFYMTEVVTPPVAVTTVAALPISIGPQDLATVDEPVLIVRVLRDHPASEIAALADQGDPIATYLLGYMFEYGVGVPEDPARARDWLEKAAAFNTPYGELELAAFLRKHLVNEADKPRALDLFKAAAAQRYAKAQAHLGDVLMTGDLAAHDGANYQRGLDLLRQAAAHGYPYAMFAVALRGAPEERAENVRALQGLAEAGNTDGAGWLCELAAAAGDYAAAAPDCKIAARVGFATAQARLSIAYHLGLGVERSDEDARHWAKLALSQSVLESSLRAELAFAN